MDDGAHDLERLKAHLQIEVKKIEADMASRLALWEEEQVRAREVWLRSWAFEQQTLQSMFKAIVDYSLAAIRGLVLVNGGAIVGIVTFTGNIWSRGGSPVAKTIVPALSWFVAGLTLALLTAGVAFLAQVIFAEMPRPQPAIRIGNRVRLFGILLAALSLCSFAIGAFMSVRVFGAP